MPRTIFNKIYDELKVSNEFARKYNPVTRSYGIHTRVRFCAALQLLVSGNALDSVDQYFKMGETTAHEAMKSFCKLVIQKFGDRYLNRCPTMREKQDVLELMKRRGFPGAFASWDCKHFVWKNCPVAWNGTHYHHKDKKKSLILEAISDPFGYIWYYHFGEPGSLNDLNILDKSTMVGAILNQTFDTQVEPYRIDNQQRDWLYFLVDGIYPKWSIFAKTIPEHLQVGEKETKYAARHEWVRKDVERCFGILIQRFGILERPLRSWYTDDIDSILRTCIILHNMVVEHAKPNFKFNDAFDPLPFDNLPGQDPDNPEDPQLTMERFFSDTDGVAFAELPLGTRVTQVNDNMADKDMHEALKEDLINHIYKYYTA